MDAYTLNVEDPVPSFSAKDQNGNAVTDKQLRGQPYVIYFYPKDETPGCTAEACDFRDHMHHIQSLDARIIGVSPDSAASHQKFIANHQLNYTLLCDENHELARKFDVWRNKPTGAALERTTFVVNADGIIVWIERNVDVKGHAKRVQTVLEEVKHGPVM